MAQDASRMAATITVSGSARVEAEPDLAQLRVGVETRGPAAERALRENSAATQAVIDRLAAAGVAARDIQTSGFAVRPLFDRRDDVAETRGFAVVNAVEATIRDLDGLGEVLDGLIADGANRIDGLSFGLSDPSASEDTARRDAVADARRKAETIAEAAGLALGPIVEIRVGEPDHGGPIVARVARMEAAAVPVAAGSIGVSAAVTIVWTLTDRE